MHRRTPGILGRSWKRSCTLGRVTRNSLKVGRIGDPIWQESPPIPDLQRRRPKESMLTGGKKFGVIAVAVALLAVGALVARQRRDQLLAACGVFSADAIERAVGSQRGVGRSDLAESGAPPGTTVCNYGRGQGVALTVFTVSSGGSFYVSQKRAAEAHGNPRDLSRAGYQAFALDDVLSPPGPQTFFLVKHDRYVNVVVYNASPGAAELLAAEAAAAIR
jgi:hypothetical protein